MNKSKTISEVCSIVALAYQSIGDYSYPSDCFCDHSVCSSDAYQNAGLAVDYVRKAVLNQLKTDGYSIYEAFNPETGRELTDNTKDGVR